MITLSIHGEGEAMPLWHLKYIFLIHFSNSYYPGIFNSFKMQMKISLDTLT